MPRSVLARAVDAVLEATVVASFSKAGPAVRSRLDGWRDAPGGVLAGRVAVVTGATSGIGAAVASGLRGLGATVHAVGRDEAKLAHTIGALGGGPGAVAQPADLARLVDVRALLQRVVDATDRVDVLAHVAGVMADERTITDDGIELTAQVHVVAPHVLTSGLLARLGAAGDARVITMSSGGMYTRALDVDALLDPPEPFDGTAAYAQAKRAQVELNAEWARRHRDAGIGFHSMHPGWVDTPGLRESLPRFARRLERVLRTPEQGADTACWLAWSPSVEPPGGRFWLDRRPRHTVVAPWTATSDEERAALWAAVAALAGTGAG
jgi:dehydrogenase/reductase SDR family member 12